MQAHIKKLLSVALILSSTFSQSLAQSDAPADDFVAAEAASTSTSSTAKISGVDFNFAEGQSKLVIKVDGEFDFEKVDSTNENQIILEIKNAKIDQKYSRRLDTSSFKSNVTLISPYQMDNNVRLVLQLKKNGPVNVEKLGNELIASIDNMDASTDIFAQPATPAEATTPAPTEEASTAQASSKNNLEQFIESHETKKYVGKKISLQLREVDLPDVFQVISDTSNFNIVLSDEVRGKVTLNLSEVPWDQALDVILHSNKLAAERNGNVLRVTTLDGLAKEKDAEVNAKRSAEAAEPLVVKIFPISYAKPDDMKKILDDFLSKENNGGSIAGAKRGSIQIDPRTNALVVRDTPTTIEKISKILTELDTQTPQVLIEAKFVEVSDTSNKNLQGRIFATSREFDASSNQLTFRGSQNNYGALFGGSDFGTSQFPNSFAVTPVAGASFGFAPRAGLIPGIGEIASFISILESEQQGKVIASPRIVTQNKEAAEISQGQSIQIPTVAGANSTGSFTSVNAVLKLVVTPSITNDGSITMKINFSQEAPSNQQIGSGTFSTDTKKVDTSVLVDSGATLVIGGIYSSTTRNSEAGIPFLRDIPLLGILFGSKVQLVTKSELFIFLTPRVINEKEAGISG